MSKRLQKKQAASTEIFETSESFSMNLQCEEFDSRMKYLKIELFKSQKVSAHSLDELHSKAEAAYEFCKKTVLRRYNQLATEISGMRSEEYHFPLPGTGPHPVSQANLRAYEARRQAPGSRNHALEAPALNPEVVNQ